jgi:hypothetical protein
MSQYAETAAEFLLWLRSFEERHRGEGLVPALLDVDAVAAFLRRIDEIAEHAAEVEAIMCQREDDDKHAWEDQGVD